MPRTSGFLRNVLVLDAVATSATALVLIAGAGALAGVLGLSSSLLRGAGLALVPFVAFVAGVARIAARERPPTGAVVAIAVCNALWVAASVGFLVGVPVAPTALGYAFVLAQAAAVAGFAELQVMGLRRARAMA